MRRVFELQRVAAPAEAQLFKLFDGLGRGDGAGVQRRAGVIEDRLRRELFVAAFLHRREMAGGVGIAAFRRHQPGLIQVGLQRLAGVQRLGQALERGIGQIQPSHAQRGLHIGQGGGRLPR